METSPRLRVDWAELPPLNKRDDLNLFLEKYEDILDFHLAEQCIEEKHHDHFKLLYIQKCAKDDIVSARIELAREACRTPENDLEENAEESRDSVAQHGRISISQIIKQIKWSDFVAELRKSFKAKETVKDPLDVLKETISKIENEDDILDIEDEILRIRRKKLLLGGYAGIGKKELEVIKVLCDFLPSHLRVDVLRKIMDDEGEIDENVDMEKFLKSIRRAVKLAPPRSVVPRKSVSFESGFAGFKKVKRCLYCDVENCTKRNCVELKKDVDAGLVVVYSDGYVKFASSHENVPTNIGKGGMMDIVRRTTSTVPPISNFIRLSLNQDDDEEDVRSSMVKRKNAEEDSDRRSKRPWEIQKETEKSFKYKSGLDKEFDSPEELVSKMLKTKVEKDANITYGSILKASPELRKVLAERIRSKRVPVEEVTAQLIKADRVVGTAVVTANICDTMTIDDVIVDNGSEISIIRWDLVCELGLQGSVQPAREKLKLAAGGMQAELMGTIANVKVELEGQPVLLEPFVVEKADYKLLLGKNWSKALKIKEGYCEDTGDTILEFKDDHGEVKKIVAKSSRSPDSVKASRVALEKDGFREIGTLEVASRRYMPASERKSLPRSGDSEVMYRWPSSGQRQEVNRWTKERLDGLKLDDIVLSNGTKLLEKEKEHLVKVLQENDKAFSFSYWERGTLDPKVIPPHKVPVIEHEPFVEKTVRIPRKLEERAKKTLQEAMKYGKFELSKGSYASKWFVLEKPGTEELRFILDCQPVNKISRRMAGTLPTADEISEAVAGYWGYCQLDVHAMYDQFMVDPESRDLFAFASPIGLLRMCVLPMGYQNSPFLAQTAMEMIFQGGPKRYIYMDDLTLVTKSRVFESVLVDGERKSVLEMILSLEKTLKQAIEVGMTFGGRKFKLFVSSIKVVGYECSQEGRKPLEKNVVNVVEWPRPKTLKELRGFVQAASFYRCWIEKFAVKMEPLYKLMRKSERFIWTDEQEMTIENIKRELMQYPVLRPPDFDNEKGFILTTDAGPLGGGAVLCQEDQDGKRYVVKYISFIWSAAERNYAQIKRELTAMVKSLKAAKLYVYGMKLMIETDCKPLIGVINNHDTIDPVLSRWIAYVTLFAPDIVHIKGKENVVADVLSRTKFVDCDEDGQSDDEEFEKLYGYKVTLGDDYDDVETFLKTLQRPEGMDDKEYKNLVKKSLQFMLKDGYLYKRPSRKYEMPRKVVRSEEEKKKILYQCHDGAHGGGHKSVNATFGKIAHRFCWKNMYVEVEKYVKTCQECQKLSVKRMREPLQVMASTGINRKWSVDILQMTMKRAGKKFDYVILARDDFGWVEGKPIKTKKAKEWVQFLFENIVCRWGVGQMIVADNGELASDESREWIEKFGLWVVFTTPNHPQSNGLVERGHQSILKTVAAILKQHDIHESRWHEVFYAALWADRVTVNRSTGYTPFFLVYGEECVLPIEFDQTSWRALDWKYPMERAKLLENRTIQLLRLEKFRKQAAENLKNNRQKSAEAWNRKHVVRDEPLKENDYVLMWDAKRANSYSMKLDNRWIGPFKIVEVCGNGTYKLSELDGSILKRAVAGDSLKKFWVRVHAGDA